MRHKGSILSFAFTILLLFAFAAIGRAQVLGEVQADIHHPFTLVDTTLPAGHYSFHILQGSDRTLMTAMGRENNVAVEFEVRQAIDTHTPRHTELIFNRYGNEEFLTHIFEGGNKYGVAVVQNSREEDRLKKQGQTPYEHTEEQDH